MARCFKYFFLLTLCLGILKGKSQTIKNFKFDLKGDSVIITYDLTADDNKKTIINLYSSHNNFSDPLKLLKGNIGDSILPGNGKQIIWQAKKELGEYKGTIRLKIEAELAPFIKFSNLSHNQFFRRGKTYELHWNTNITNPAGRLFLIRNKEEIVDQFNITKSNSFEWTIPKQMKTGKNYSFKIKINKTYESSPEFKIKNKVPIGLTIVPAAIIVGGTVLYLTISNTGSTQKNKIPDPFLPK